METAAQPGKTRCRGRSWENNASNTHQGNLRFGKLNRVVAATATEEASPQLPWREGRPCLSTADDNN